MHLTSGHTVLYEGEDYPRRAQKGGSGVAGVEQSRRGLKGREVPGCGILYVAIALKSFQSFQKYI